MKFVNLQHSLKVSHSMKGQLLELGVVAPICESSIWVLRQPEVNRHKTLFQLEKRNCLSNYRNLGSELWTELSLSFNWLPYSSIPVYLPC